MRQRWQDLAYLHWRYDAAEVQRQLPQGLQVDTFDGSAWVGLVPFHMKGIAGGARWPAVPYLGSFPETNVRTYVTGPDGPGVWFNSLDISRLLPVAVARATYRLPYMFSKMDIDRDGAMVSYRTRRRWPHRRHPESLVRLRVADRIIRPTELEHFLTARWRLYTLLGKRLTVARVEHDPWPLHRATLQELSDELVEAAGYSAPLDPPHVLFSPGVGVRIDLPRTVA